jgi:hypothetical protein
MSRAKLSLWVLGIFLMGAFFGGVAASEYQRRNFSRIMEGGPKTLGGVISKKMADELGLDASQRPPFEAVMAEVHEGIREIRRQARPQIDKILADARPKILALLRPDQIVKFEKMEARHKEARNHNRPPEGGFPPPPPPDGPPQPPIGPEDPAAPPLGLPR